MKYKQYLPTIDLFFDSWAALNLLDPAFEHGSQLAGDVDGVGFDCFHAGEDETFETLAFLVQRIESNP